MKRSRHHSSSEDSDNGSSSTCWSQHSTQPRRTAGQKPSEVFRTDLITAMKVHDSYQLNPEDYYVLADPWRQEWEKGVQVPVSPQSIPQPVVRTLAEKEKEVMFVRPKKLIRTSGTEALGYVDIRTLAEGMCRYDLNEQDVAWLQIANKQFAEMGLPPLDEITMERVLEELEHRCHENMTHAMETEEGLGIEYDEDVVCDVCQSPDGEDNNEMVFCDKCNICVHQACYGIQKVPKGSWLCRICALGILPKCQLCPKKGGAMKPTRSGTKWVHVSCALWIPEVSIGNPEKMEPITNVSQIPSNRWALICCLCKEKTGACIQCSAKNCRTAFHVTCGLHASLEMNTILTEEDEVKFKSYCPKHSGLDGAEDRDSGGEEEFTRDKRRRIGRTRGGGGEEDEEEEEEEEDAAAAASCLPASSRRCGPAEALSSQQQEKRVNLRKLKLEAMEEEFYLFVGAEEVAQHLKLSPEAADFLYQYWKLKRKANFNQPLLTPKKDEEDSLARREQEVLRCRLQLFTHLRQDLERVRNLTYMVTRREKMKRSMWKVQEQIFQHQVRLLDHELLTGDPSAKDLEKLLFLGWVPSPDPQSRSSCSQSGLKTKPGPVKVEKQKLSNRKSLDSLPAHRKDGSSGLPGSKDSRGSQNGEPGSESDTKSSQEIPLQEPGEPERSQEMAQLCKLESRKALRKEPPGPPQEDLPGQEPEEEQEQEEQEERRKKRRTDMMDRFRFKHLEKSVSIRLVDIRNSDSSGFSTRSPFRSSVLLSDTTVGTKANGWLKKSASSGGSHAPARAAAGHLRSWGKFRIPKRSEKTAGEEQQQQLLLRPLTNAASQPRTRLRAGAENKGYNPKAAEGEVEPCLKRCHSHQLRGDSSLGRRYGSDIIRRGVLAS